MSEGCYICRPDDPNAAEEGCSTCEADWLAYYVVAYADVIGGVE